MEDPELERMAVAMCKADGMDPNAEDEIGADDSWVSEYGPRWRRYVPQARRIHAGVRAMSEA